MKKLGKFLIGVFITIFIVITTLITIFIYNTKIKVIDIAEFVNEENSYKIVFQAVGEPEWPFGRTKVKVNLANSKGKVIKSFEEYISDDGAIARKENIKVNWYDDHVEVVLRGEEQEDDVHKISFKD